MGFQWVLGFKERESNGWSRDKEMHTWERGGFNRWVLWVGSTESKSRTSVGRVQAFESWTI